MGASYRDAAGNLRDALGIKIVDNSSYIDSAGVLRDAVGIMVFSDAKTGAIGVNVVSGVYVDAGGLPRDPVGARIVPGAYMDVAGQLRDPMPIFYIEAPVINALLGPLDFAPLHGPTDNAPLIYTMPPVTSGWNDLSIWDDTQLWSDDA
ncbi:hypothetical protein AEAC466_13510 [Asticcacaulis sp. AC466]|uniref:hypothetical protein n=1 Tax=Asticcacaulis sp. AC466 TaxID=1282362 RepID=UPI0003C3BA58|nr:hypothetical protein [Asticcacaulis sp. AC466]ESQ83264.1 hypothetical protein AEAC466_13510 [Asticcacaulis sp. AC466]